MSITMLEEKELVWKLKMIGDNVFIKPLDEREKKLRSGIIIPNAQIKKSGIPRYGIVLKIGPGEKYGDGNIKPMDVKAGDLVVYGEFLIKRFKVMGQEYHVVCQKDIYGICDKGTEISPGWSESPGSRYGFIKR